MSDSRIQLANGALFDLLEPDPDLIDIEVIASSLSKLCRFTGHTREFYSVAQHCVVVSRLVEPEYALAGLLHDASEAFIGDVSTPLKALLPDYKRIEEEIQWAIMEAFHVETEFTTSVKQADLTAMALERRDLGITGNDEFWAEHWPMPDPPREYVIVPQDMALARTAFLARFAEIQMHRGAGQAPTFSEEAVEEHRRLGTEQLDPRRLETNRETSRRLSREEEGHLDWMEVIG